ncbi:3-hydroxyisobutyrate dehydrogenase [Halomonas sp. 1513]|nr:NAD(P)-dependent oxidoreductase [Halomonas sp. 1513]APX92248.1 3-hydroxyisobutyrate dehydrogenase [Halomonas sp. 1513]
MNNPIRKVGFIGAGHMGHGMAKNIIEKGFSLTILGHHNRDPINDLVSRGACEVDTLQLLAKESEIIFLCVPDSKIVENIIRGPHGLINYLRPGIIIVDCSTSDPNSTLELAKELENIKAKLVDAPLGRSPKEAWQGTLDTMVGCDKETFNKIKPVLESWAGRVIHIGETGDGHKIKLINNFISLGYAALYAEALTLSKKIGIKPERFDNVIRGSRMDCEFYRSYMQYVIERDQEAHKFTLKNAFKDMQYLDSMSNKAGISNPLSNGIKNIFALAVNSGNGEKYIPMISDQVAAWNDTDLHHEE